MAAALAAVVLGGTRLGGGRGTIPATIPGVTLDTMTAKGLNLRGIGPDAFNMVLGFVILVAITMSNISDLEQLLCGRRRRLDHGVAVTFLSAHPILVSLGMMIFLSSLVGQPHGCAPASGDGAQGRFSCRCDDRPLALAPLARTDP